MATFLLVIIYVVYIGLGIPDSALGAAWPKMYLDLGVLVGGQSIVAILVSVGTVSASFFSAKIINKMGTGLVSALSTALTAVALLGFALSPNIWWIYLCSLPLGFGAGAIDAALNNYVAVHYKSTHMSFMHCFYGLGVIASPFVMSLTLSLANGWRLGYGIIFIIQAVLTVISLVALPLWKKVKRAEPEEEQFTPRTLTNKEMFKMPAVRAGCVVFFFATSLEFTCDMWASTYLVQVEGLLADVAAGFLSLYYAGILIGRFVNGLIGTKLSCGKILTVGYSLIALSIVVLFLPIPAQIKGYVLFLLGFGIGPTFPNLTYMTPINFGKDVSQSIVGLQMVACNVGILLMPPIFGLLAEKVSVALFPIFIALLFAVQVAYTFIYDHRLKKTGKGL